MRVAIVHEWFETYAGSERVVEQILAIYPDADVFALVDFLPPDGRGFIRNKPVTTSFIQRMPFARRRFRYYLPLFPLAIEQLDLSGYDLVISSNHAAAKGVRTGPDQIHICMCHSPMRYAWDLQEQYLAELRLTRGPLSFIVRQVLHNLRIWDVASSTSVDSFVANSHFVAGRIRKFYRRESQVVYPPVAIDLFPMRRDKEEFYLAASRLVPYKCMGLIAEAFAAMPTRKLVIIGQGTEQKHIQKLAREHSNITYLPTQPQAALRDYMQRAKAFVFAGKEDFGITPLEAQACGTPVIAFNGGGVAETVRGLDHDEPTGVFFERQTTDDIQRAVALFERQAARISPEACRRNAESFAPERFRAEFADHVTRTMAGMRGLVASAKSERGEPRRIAAVRGGRVDSLVANDADR